MPSQVVCVASWNTDLTIRIPRPLRKGETLLGSGFEQGPGGKGSNATIACARQGVSTAIVARIGDDDFGRNGLTLWASEGIDTTAVVVAPGERSGVAQILIYDDGDNSIAVAPGAGAGLNARHLVDRRDLLQSASVVMASNEVPESARLQAFELAKASPQGVITLLNPAPAQALSAELLACCDVLTPNEHELRAMMGASDADDLHEVAARMMQGLPALKALVVTLGAKGCGLWHREGPQLQCTHIPGLAVAHIEDTVGAGDTFTGALAAALAKGMGWVASARHANAAAALSVTGRGAIGGMPTWAQTQALIAQQG